MDRRRVWLFGMLGLGVGYFLWYTPYSGLAKAISGGLLPGAPKPIGGLVLLPASVLGQLLVMPVFVAASGMWRYSRTRRVFGRRVLFPARYTIESAFWMAFIVGTTSLNFTFPGASIVFMLVLMRASTLIIGPTVDLLRRRTIHWYSAVALVLCMVSVVIALTDIHNYALTVGAVLSLAFYALGYFLRFRIMSAHAKTEDPVRGRQYFIEEHMATPVLLLAMVGVPALIDQGAWMHALRVGFTSFLTTPMVVPALLIGVCYEGLYIMTSLIFLDRREFSFGVPVHTCASLLAGVVASLGLAAVFGAPEPSHAQYVAAAAVICGALALSYPTIRARLAILGIVPSRTLAEQLLLFVCGGNTCRSPIAAAIARAEIAGDSSMPRWRVGSAGVSDPAAGAPISPLAVTALTELGLGPPTDHHARTLTPEMCANTSAVYCMTLDQRDKVIAMVPEAAPRTFCLDPEADVPDPVGQPLDAYRNCASRLQKLVRARLAEHRDGYAVSGAETG
jgi:protein-tyrosine-phosphatase